jgi:hypothetical protein
MDPDFSDALEKPSYRKTSLGSIMPGEECAPYYRHSKIGHRNALAPVVQDIDLVGERYLRSF